jgi:hypothetical protein
MRLSLLPLALLCLAAAAFSETDQPSANGDLSPGTVPSVRRQAPDLGRFGLLRFGELATDAPGDVCYMLRTYKVERDEESSDETRIVAEYKCQHASKFSVKKTKPRELPEP